MATRRAPNRDRSPVSDQRALKSGQRQLEIEVRETLRRLIGHPLRYGVAQTDSRLGLVSGFGHDDEKAPITTRQFASLAEKAAKEKASELGWFAPRGGRGVWVDKHFKR
jgi:hypothetical protein